MIKANIIIHISGKPVNLVEDAMKRTREKLEEDKSKFKVISCEIADVEEDSETTLFNGFLEVLIDFKSMSDILNFVVDYNPTSIEVEDPSSIKLDNFELTEFLNVLASVLLKGQHEVRTLRAMVHQLQEKNK